MARRAETLGVAAGLIVALSLAACGATGKKQPVAMEASTRVGALALPVPSGFSRRVIRGHEELLGVLLTDYRVKPGSSTLTEGIFPTNSVALSLARGATLGAKLPPLRLPLSLDKLRAQRHADGTAWNGVFGFHEWLYAVTLWVGSTSPSQDQAAVKRALLSIRAER